jgi:hypothetical protein
MDEQYVQQEQPERRRNLKERLEKLESDSKLKGLAEETKKEAKEWKWPWQWKNSINRASRSKEQNKILVFYLNIRGEMEQPMMMPYRDNMILYKNKVHEFDPRAIITIKSGMKSVRGLLIREIDRRPVSNLDYADVRNRGDATDSDELLIKAAASLYLAKDEKKKPMNYTILIIIGVIILGGIIFFMTRK